MSNKYVPEGPVEYLIFRFQGYWELTEEQCAKIATALYGTKDPDAQTLALQADELSDHELELLFPYLPGAVVRELDEIAI